MTDSLREIHRIADEVADVLTWLRHEHQAVHGLVSMAIAEAENGATNDAVLTLRHNVLFRLEENMAGSLTRLDLVLDDLDRIDLDVATAVA